MVTFSGVGGLSTFDFEEIRRRMASAQPGFETLTPLPGLWGFDTDEVTAGVLPPELKEFVDSRADVFGETVDTPDEVRQLLQMLHQGEGGTDLPRLETGNQDLAALGDADLLAMLIDYIANFNRPEQNRTRPSLPRRSRHLGRLSGGRGTYAPSGAYTPSGGGGGGSVSSGPAPTGGSGRSYGSLKPPAELAQYGNGRIPAEALEEIGVGNHRLYAPAAQAFRQMREDAAKDGVNIGVTDSYRSYEAQVDVANRKGLYSQGGLAAEPGTSNHGWGMALDLDLDANAQAWMRANAGQYGFVEDVPREPWHWTFRPEEA